MNVAPPTRTRSVTKNRVLAAAYAGAHRFGVEVFEPATTKVLMAALLVHDLHTGGGPAHEHPWQDEAYGPRTAGCGGRRTHPAARSGWPRCSATAPPAPDPDRRARRRDLGHAPDSARPTSRVTASNLGR